MPTEVVSAIRSSGGDYTSLSAWEAGEQRDLVAGDEVAVAECYADWPSGLSNDFSMGGWTMDDTRYCKIRAAAGHEHNGVRLGQGGAGFAITSTSGFGTIRPTGFKLVIENIEIINTNGPCIDYFSSAPANAQLHIDGCIMSSTGLSANNYAADLTGSSGNVYVRNCLVLSNQRCMDVRSNTNQVLENTTLHGDSDYGMMGGLLTNVVCFGHTTKDFHAPLAGSDYCASGDSTAPGSNSITGITTADFTNTASNDYSLPSGSSLIDVGDDLSANFTLDITGATRSVPWDIGAYEFVGGGSTPVSSDTDLRWGILQSAQQDASIQWHILNTVFQDSDLRWSLLEAVQGDASLQWSILQAIHQDADLRWSIQAALSAVVSDSDLRWSILNAVQQDAQIDWSILQSAINDTDLRWSVLNEVLQDADVRWSVLNRIVSDADLRWSVLSAVLQDIDIRWGISGPAGTVTSDLDLRWSILAAVYQSLNLQWDILNSITEDTDIRWQILNAISNDSDLRWAILQSAENDANLQWNIISATERDITLRWTIEGENVFPDLTGDITLSSKTPVFSVESLTPKITIH
jgi:hypothetical protein